MKLGKTGYRNESKGGQDEVLAELGRAVAGGEDEDVGGGQEGPEAAADDGVEQRGHALGHRRRRRHGQAAAGLHRQRLVGGHPTADSAHHASQPRPAA